MDPLWDPLDVVELDPGCGRDAELVRFARSILCRQHSFGRSDAPLSWGSGGSGRGSQSSWITDDVATNGPNLTGVAIHVYPAGNINGPEPPTTWLASLQSGSALPTRVNSTLSEVNATCPTCHLDVLADEPGTGTLVPQGDEITGAISRLYVSAEILQSLPLRLASADYYNLESETPGAWFSPNGAPSPAYFAYSNWAEQVGSDAAPLGVSSKATGLLAAVGGASAGTLTNLILVNVNTSFTFSLNLSKDFADVAEASILTWNGSSGSPSNLTWGPAGTNEPYRPADESRDPLERGSVRCTGPPAELGAPRGTPSRDPYPSSDRVPPSTYGLESFRRTDLHRDRTGAVARCAVRPRPRYQNARTGVTHLRFLAGAARWQ